MHPELAVIANKRAGGSDDQRLAEISKVLADSGLNYQLLEVAGDETAEEIATKAIRAGAKRLCACGGDGTVADVVNAILKSGKEDLILTILPMGTANLIATALGIPHEVSTALGAFANGRVREIDAAKIEDTYFVLGIGIGATERFVTQTGGQVKKTFGRLAYAFSLFRQTSSRPFKLQIIVDCKERGVHSAEAITLASFWGTSHLKLLESSDPSDGRMEVLINKRLTKPGLIRLAWHGLWGRLQRDEDVTLYVGKQFKIETDPRLPIQLDGNEKDLKTPATVEVLHRALKVFVPEV
jgi:diacylglycerol kinase (ATP)